MASNRIGRINEEIQRELSAQFRQLKDAKIYVSVLDKSQEKDVLKGLKSASGFLRRELGHALQLRYTPELQFIGDDSIQHGAHILELLRQEEQKDAARGGGADPETEE